MAGIHPFKAIRPKKGLEDRIAALPYDVYNRAEAKEVVAGEELSFLKIDRAETQFDDSVDTYDPCVYQKAHDMLWDMIEKGQFIQDEKECYYIYELTMNGRSQSGIVAASSVDDYMNNVIKKHENTRADKEVDRINHVDICNAQTGPIFLAYRSKEEINAIVNKKKQETPVYDFIKEDDVTHRVWVIDDASEVETIRNAFASINEIYIADGHHRCASAVKVSLKRREANPDYTGAEEFNRFLSVLFPDDQLMIMDYNRVVKDLNGLSNEEFLAKIEAVFECEKIAVDSYSQTDKEGKDAVIKPAKKGQVSMYLDGDWYKMSIKDQFKTQDPVKGLDVSLLQENILAPVLGIEDPKTDKRIDFVGGIRGLAELEKRVANDCKVAFLMYPTSIGELFAVSDADLLMPPKSTWFEPKLRSGLFIHSLKD
ncbi:MAG: DUF1015 domain-containing protein [Lachnospiraceae bacterium]|nr:DUF1015 domain-containing protein [Lachnospiraceae bacterium]